MCCSISVIVGAYIEISANIVNIKIILSDQYIMYQFVAKVGRRLNALRCVFELRFTLLSHSNLRPAGKWTSASDFPIVFIPFVAIPRLIHSVEKEHISNRTRERDHSGSGHHHPLTEGVEGNNFTTVVFLRLYI